MFVLGANDGELPMFAEDAGLIDDAEKEILEKRLGLVAFRREENLHGEEQLSIYKNLSKPTRLLHVSYTGFGADGKEETKPSRVFERLRALFPDLPLERAGITEGGYNGLPGAIQKDRPLLALDAEKMRALLPPVLSPTAIEKYSRCPFAFLMDRGLKLKELRKHEIDNRGMGDVYHEALRRFGEAMNEQGGAPVNEDSAWNTAERYETDAIVEGIFRGLELEAQDHDGKAKGISAEGALIFDGSDPAAVYRRERLESIVKNVCQVLTERAAQDGAERILFETDFGYGGEFGRVRIGDEGLEIAGRIDRIDILPGGRAKVIDYKSGSEKWNAENVKNGWQLQPMIYLKAVEKAYLPSGVSYFRIFEPHINLSGKGAPASPKEISEAVDEAYNNDGVYRGEKTGKGTKTPFGERVLSDEEFDTLRAEVDECLAGIASGLSRGESPAEPKKKAGGDNVTACTWCNYKSICNYETT